MSLEFREERSKLRICWREASAPCGIEIPATQRDHPGRERSQKEKQSEDLGGTGRKEREVARGVGEILRNNQAQSFCYAK